VSKVYRVEAKKKLTGEWIVYPDVPSPLEVWGLLANLYVSTDEMIVRTLDGNIHVHVMDDDLVFPEIGEQFTEQQKSQLLTVVKSRMN